MYDYQETYKQHVLVSYGWQPSEKKDGVKFEVFVYRDDDFNFNPTSDPAFVVKTFLSGPRKAVLGNQEVQSEKDQKRDELIIRTKQKIDRNDFTDESY